MSWTNELYNVYERNWGKDGAADLLPIVHSTANAQIEVTIDESGNFVDAVVLDNDKENVVTVIPVTEDSGSRTNNIAPHPFADVLVYIAGDYSKYCDKKKARARAYYDAYVKQLEEWVSSPYSHKAAEILLSYIKRGNVVHDIISRGALIADDAGKLKSGVKINGIEQEKVFVRFRINYNTADCESRTWEDVSLRNAYIEYNLSLPREKQLCYATGEVVPVSYKHPAKIRNTGDKCKLISANDDTNFTYRGRFANEKEATSIGYVYSQKVHNALRWLIKKQGVHFGSLSVVVWENSMQEFPQIKDIVDSAGNFVFDDDSLVDTLPEYKDKVKKTVLGYQNHLKEDSKAIIMGVDSATIGRLSIGMYSELESSEFFENVERWYNDTAWFRFNGPGQYVIDTTSLKHLIVYAFGTENKKKEYIEFDNSKVESNFMYDLISCVIERKKVPKALINALIRNASNPHKYKNESNWKKVLNAACSMIRKEKTENMEECGMALDEKCTDRSYLYGRLLAVADVAEERTYKGKESRTTNAKRYFEAFSDRPCQTWNIIRQRLVPYLDKLDKENTSGYRERHAYLIDAITDMFNREEFADNSKLDPIFLHAYSCQVRSLYEKKHI